VREVDYCSPDSLGFRAQPGSSWGHRDEDSATVWRSGGIWLPRAGAGLKVLYQPLSGSRLLWGIPQGQPVTQRVTGSDVPKLERLFRALEHRLCEHSEAGSRVECARDRCTVGRALVIDHLTPMPDQDAGSVVAVGMIEALQALDTRSRSLPDNCAFVPGYTAPCSAEASSAAMPHTIPPSLNTSVGTGVVRRRHLAAGADCEQAFRRGGRTCSASSRDLPYDRPPLLVSNGRR